MTYTAGDAHEIVKKIRYDLTAAQAKLTELQAALNALDVPDRPKTVCPECGPIHLPKGTSLTDHRANVHGVHAA